MPEHYLNTPLSEETVRRLKIGDILYLSGDAYTGLGGAGDCGFAVPYITKAVKAGETLPFRLEGMIYNQRFTSSARYAHTVPAVIQYGKVRCIMGKGGLNTACLDAMKTYGCVYASCAAKQNAFYFQHVVESIPTNWPEELPERHRVVRQVLKNLGPLILTMDANGNSIYHEVEKKIDENYEAILKRLGARDLRPPYHLSRDLTR